jgi:hypothetical protein
MQYSKSHQTFIEPLPVRALAEPQEFLGPNYEAVLNFWWYLDIITEEQQDVFVDRYRAINARNRARCIEVAGVAANTITTYADAACDSARIDWYGVKKFAAAYATWELIGMHTLLEQGRELVFVPLFDFSKEETKEEPPLFYMTEIRPPTGEIFNMRMVRPQTTFISTPNGVGIGEWIQQFTNSPITHNYYQYSRPTYQE